MHEFDLNPLSPAGSGMGRGGPAFGVKARTQNPLTQPSPPRGEGFSPQLR